MTHSKPRKGSSYINSKGNRVVRRDHTWKPPSGGDSGNSGTVSGKSTAAGLVDLAQDSKAPAGIWYRYEIGEPVETKPEWLDTEIGRVEFTEDLVLGFNDAPQPLTQDEA